MAAELWWFPRQTAGRRDESRALAAAAQSKDYLHQLGPTRARLDPWPHADSGLVGCKSKEDVRSFGTCR